MDLSVKGQHLDEDIIKRSIKLYIKIVELKCNKKLYVYIPLVATCFGHFNHHQTTVTQNLKD